MPGAWLVEPPVSNSGPCSSTSTSVTPSSVRWYAADTPTMPAPMMTVCARSRMPRNPRLACDRAHGPTAECAGNSLVARCATLGGAAPVMSSAGEVSIDVIGRVVHGGDRTEPARLEVLERRDELVARVHDERPVPRHGLADRTAAEHEHLQLGRPRLLPRRSGDTQAVAGAEHRELAGVDRPSPRRRPSPAPASTYASALYERSHGRSRVAPGDRVACTQRDRGVRVARARVAAERARRSRARARRRRSRRAGRPPTARRS